MTEAVAARRVRVREVSKHVVVRTWGVHLYCRRCAAEMEIPTGVRMRYLAKMALRWELMHRHCPKPPPEPKK